MAASFRIALPHIFMDEIIGGLHPVVRSIPLQGLFPGHAHLDVFPFVGGADGTGVFVVPNGFCKKAVVTAGATGRKIETAEIAFQRDVAREEAPFVRVEITLSIEMIITSYTGYDEFIVKGGIAQIGCQHELVHVTLVLSPIIKEHHPVSFRSGYGGHNGVLVDGVGGTKHCINLSLVVSRTERVFYMVEGLQKRVAHATLPQILLNDDVVH